MDRQTYVENLKGLLSRDPDRIREANRAIYRDALGETQVSNTEADLVLAEAAADD